MSYRTRVFKSGNSLAVRIPKAFHLQAHQQVELVIKNNEIVLRIVPKTLADAFALLQAFPDDMLQEEIEDLPPQKRDF